MIDADKLAKRVLSPEYDRFTEVTELLKKNLEPDAKWKTSRSIFSKDTKRRTKIDRSVLAELVFSSKENLERLNQIVHPEVQRLFEESLTKANQDQAVIYDTPLLFENNLQREFKKTILVFAPEEVCIERASQRTGLPKKQIAQRMKMQISIEEKKNLADHVIDNSGDKNQLKMEVARIWQLIHSVESA